MDSRLLFVAMAGVAFASAPEPTVREFRIDAGHSDIAFSIGFLGHPVRGRFDDIRGTIVYAAGKPGASAITVVIGAKSIATGSAHRDEHLRSADFFDVARYPSIVFRSTTIESRGAALVANGVLTMHGVSRVVSIPFRESSPPIVDPHGSTIVLFSGQLRIARKDFGILGGSKYNDWFDEIRSATMADSVDISLDITGWDTDFDRIHQYDAPLQRIERDGIASTLERLRSLDLSDWHFRIFAHELAQPTPAMNVVVNEAIRPLYSRMGNLLGSLLRLPPEHEKTRLCAHSIIGQILFYAFARSVISRLAPEMKMTATQIDLIADHIAEFSLAYLRQTNRKRLPTKGKKR